jgi:hypothetical protein
MENIKLEPQAGDMEDVYTCTTQILRGRRKVEEKNNHNSYPQDK